MKSIKNHLNKIAEKRITSNKDFWSIVKPFFNKCFTDSTDITLKLDQKNSNSESKTGRKF